MLLPLLPLLPLQRHSDAHGPVCQRLRGMSRSQLVESGLGSKGALFAEDASSCYALLSISTADDGDKVRLFKLLPEQPRTDLMATIGTESVLPFS